MTEPEPQPSERFDEFRRRVLADPMLLERLRRTSDVAQFIRAAVEAAREMNIELSGDEIDSALCAARRNWIERWVQ